MESNKRVCKGCGVEKDRILVGKFDNRNKKYQDIAGLTWNGHNCGKCHQAQVRLNMQLLREKRKIP